MRRNKGKICIMIGCVFIAAAFALVGFNLIRESMSERDSMNALEKLEQYLSEIESDGSRDNQSEGLTGHSLPEGIMPEVEIDGIPYIGTVTIPVLNLKLPIISRLSYQNLNIAPCRYDGSAYSDDLIIAAHNFSGHFGKLHTLAMGDQVIIEDTAGNCFYYHVAGFEEVDGKAVEEMETGEWDLTLFTCTYSGRARVTLRCEREE